MKPRVQGCQAAWRLVCLIALAPSTLLAGPSERPVDPVALRLAAAYLWCIDLDCTTKLNALVRLGSPAVPPLIAALQGKPDPKLAVNASGPPSPVRICIALGRLRDPRATPALEGVLGSEHAVLRAQALMAIGRIGDRSAITSVTLRLRDDDAYVRESAAQALAEIGRTGERAALQAALAAETSSNARTAMAQALRRIEEHPQR